MTEHPDEKSKAIRGYAFYDWGKSAFETSVTVAILPAWFAYLFLEANGLTGTVVGVDMTSDAAWALAVPLQEKDCIFGQFMSGMTYNWHQSGRLIELEQKHGIQATNYLVIQKFRNKDWLEGK